MLKNPIQTDEIRLIERNYQSKIAFEKRIILIFRTKTGCLFKVSDILKHVTRSHERGLKSILTLLRNLYRTKVHKMKFNLILNQARILKDVKVTISCNVGVKCRT